jgi:cell division protein FtsI (penicillin-binding protein 3)
MDPLAIRRVHVLVRVAFIWAALIATRLIQLQVVQHHQYAQLARDQQERLEEIKAPRGAILDRYGQRLAMSLPAESVVVDPLRVPDLTVAADVLARVLNLNARDLLANLKAAADKHRGFLWVKRKITREEAKRLRDLNLEWIEFRTESQRYYPNRTLAAHVIGSVDFAEEGNGGVEQSLNNELHGHAGELLVTEDVQKRGFASSMQREPQPGQDVRLTIDSRIQFTAEQELAKMVAQHHAKSGSLVAMDPRTGDILAMANVPTFDPNEPPKHGEIGPV